MKGNVPASNMSVEDTRVIIDYLTAVTTAQVESGEQVEIWLEVLTRTNLSTARAAIKEFATTSTEYPRPAHIGRIITRIHEQRLGSTIPLHPPVPSGPPKLDANGYVVPDESDENYRKWESEWRRLVSLGCPIETADSLALEVIGQQLTSGSSRTNPMPALVRAASSPHLGGKDVAVR